MKKYLTIILIILTAVCVNTHSYLALASNFDSSGLTASLSSSELSKTQNVVISVKTADGNEFVDASYLNKLNKMYNTDTVSMRNYFLSESLGKYDVSTVFVEGEGSLTLAHSRSYYLPKYKYTSIFNMGRYDVINTDGYDNRFYINGGVVAPSTEGAKQHIEQYYREQALLREILAHYKDSAKGVDNELIDSDNNLTVDSLTILIDSDYSRETTWNSIFWPHMSNIYNLDIVALNKTYYCPQQFFDDNNMGEFDYALFNSLRVLNYNLLSTGYIDNQVEGSSYTNGNIGVICHEYIHTLGIYDYYSYVDNSYQSVGDLDIMGATNGSPQMNLSYIRQKLGWLSEGENIIPAKQSGSFTLYATSSEEKVKAIKIVQNDYQQTGEYFIIEMRSNKFNFDKDLKANGLIVYRVNERNGYLNSSGEVGNICYGNMYCKSTSATVSQPQTDEVYVFRVGNDKTVNNQQNQSLAILDGGLVWQSHPYTKDSIGSSDINLSEKVFQDNGKFRNLIYYSNGKNSGISINDIEVSSDGTNATFKLNFPDKSESLTENGIGEKLQKYYGGTNIVTWNGGTRVGSVTTIVVEYDKALVKIEGNQAIAMQMPTATQIENGEFDDFKIICKSVTPMSFLKTKLQSEKNNAVVFSLFDDGINKFVKFVGIINYSELGDTDNQLKWDYFNFLIIVVVFLCVICLILIVLVLVHRFKKSRSYESVLLEDNIDDTTDGGQDE